MIQGCSLSLLELGTLEKVKRSSLWFTRRWKNPSYIKEMYSFMKGIYRYQLVDIDSIFSKNRCLYLWKAPADPEDHQEVTVYMPVTILNPSSTAWLWNCSIGQYHLLNTTEGLYNKQSSDNSTTFCVLINAPSVELHITKRKTGVQCWKQENKSTIFVC